MDKSPFATILMTRVSWTGVCGALIVHAYKLIGERDPSGVIDEALEAAILDYIQKLIPIIYHASDKDEWPELKQIYKDVIHASGYVVPENYEDLGKQLVAFPEIDL